MFFLNLIYLCSINYRLSNMGFAMLLKNEAHQWFFYISTKTIKYFNFWLWLKVNFVSFIKNFVSEVIY